MKRAWASALHPTKGPLETVDAQLGFHAEPESGPSPLDLRITWPERQLMIKAQMLRDPRPGAHAYARVMLPELPEFIKLCGGKMPEMFRHLKDSKFSDDMIAYWDQAVNRKHKPMPAQAALVQIKSDLRWAFQTEWWQYEGHRIYALDATTAHALLNTSLDDFPTDQFRLPVRSFFIRIPHELGWKIDLRKISPIASPFNTPIDQHPEPSQQMDGIMITGEHDQHGKLVQLNMVLSGYTKQPDLMADHMMWIEIGLGADTLGGVIRQALLPDEPGIDELPDDMEQQIIKLALGTILYITSAHPHLKAIAPPNPVTLRKALRDPKRWARAKSRSKYTTVYVGGPQEGFQEENESAPVDGLIRRPPKPHMRSGHMRHVWLGVKGTLDRHAEIRWIKPVWVGSWDRIAAFEAIKNLRLVIRKTRPAEIVEETNA